MRKPTPAELRNAAGRTVPDVSAPGLEVLFCGINPGLYSGAVGHHFARPGNRFWQVLHRSGFTPRLLSPDEEQELLVFRCGITNLVARATATAAELADGELAAGRRRLEAKVRRHAPRFLAVLGLEAFRTAFDRPKAAPGPQPGLIGRTEVWVLPNPSGLNANYQIRDLVRLFSALRAAIKNREKKGESRK